MSYSLILVCFSTPRNLFHIFYVWWVLVIWLFFSERATKQHLLGYCPSSFGNIGTVSMFRFYCFIIVFIKVHGSPIYDGINCLYQVWLPYFPIILGNSLLGHKICYDNSLHIHCVIFLTIICIFIINSFFFWDTSLYHILLPWAALNNLTFWLRYMMV